MMSVQYVAQTLIALACAAPVIAQAEETRFTCNANAFFGNTPCGEKSYKVPANKTLKFKLDRVKHNACVDVTPIDADTNGPADSPVNVCPGSITTLWSNDNERPFNVRIVIAASKWKELLGKDGLTGAVVIE